MVKAVAGATAANVIDIQTYRRVRNDCVTESSDSHVRIWFDDDDYLRYQSHVLPEHSDRMFDALLLMLIRARQADGGLDNVRR